MALGTTVHPREEPPPSPAHASDEAPWIFEAADRITPLVISIPHSGVAWPREIACPAELDLVRNADDRVEALYRQAPAHGAALLRARWSRLVVDLNRAPDDIAPHLVPDHPAANPRQVPVKVRALAKRLGLDARPRGVMWNLALGDVSLFEGLSYAQFEARLNQYYWPYYEALGVLVQRRLAAFGFAIVLDAHSMPAAIPYDLVLGTRDGQSVAPQLVDLARKTIFGDLEANHSLPYAARSALRRRDAHDAKGLRASVDDPFAGGHIVESFGRPQDGLHALQLEVNRGVYLARRAAQVPNPAEGSPSPSVRPLVPLATTPARELLERRILALVDTLAATAGSPHLVAPLVALERQRT